MIDSVQIDENCKLRQVFDQCTSPCPRTCEDIQRNTPEKACITVCKPGCKCERGYIINNMGECVPEKLCQPKGM